MIAGDLLKPAQDAGIAVLLDNADLARRIGADGVHLSDSSGYGAARKILGNDGIVGVACPSERHAAMDAGEAGADYIQFTLTADNAEDTLDLVAWWSEMMTVASVVTCPPSPQFAAAIVATGADFLAPDASLWSQGDPVAALKSLAL